MKLYCSLILIWLITPIHNYKEQAMKDNILNNIENYHTELDKEKCNICMLFLKYVGKIHDFMELALEKLFHLSDDYFRHIVTQGIKTIHYVYYILILYTKNIELTTYHTQKAVQYYVEFISQIGEGNNNYISLTSKDAVLFVYKKTIFEINQDYRNERIDKESEDTTKIVTLLTSFIQFYNSLLIYTVEKNTNNIIDIATRDYMKKLTYSHLYKIIEQLIQIPLHFNNDLKNIGKVLEDLTAVTDAIITYGNTKVKSNIVIISVEYLVKRSTMTQASNMSPSSLSNTHILDSILQKDIKNKLIHIDNDELSSVNLSYIKFLKYLNLYNVQFLL